jgi:hypothetical protein
MQSYQPLVSIVCPWHERPELVTQSLDSLIAQSYKNIEIIIIDDGSKNIRTRQLLDAYRANCKILRHENRGFVNTLIKAIEIAKGELIALHGAGDYSHPRRIECQVKDFQNASSEVVLVACNYNTINHIDGSIINSRSNKACFYDVYAIANGRHRFTHGSIMFKKHRYDQVGGYRSFFELGQDRDFFLRMLEGGHLAYKSSQLLYTRLFLPSVSVSSSKGKLLLQQFFTSFAIQCFYYRRRNDFDPVDSAGLIPFSWRLPSYKFSVYASKLALLSLLEENYKDAQKYSQRAISEHCNLITFSTMILTCLLPKIPFTSFFLQRLAPILPGYNSWSLKK